MQAPSIECYFEAHDTEENSVAFVAVEAKQKRATRGATKPRPNGACIHAWTQHGYYALHFEPDQLRALRFALAKADAPVSLVEPVALTA